MSAVAYVNGTILGEREAMVSVFDHGFVFGEGVYEVLRTYGRQPFLFEPHVRRLRESAARIALDVPFTDEALLDRVRATLAAAPDLEEAYIRIVLTRGVGEFSYDPHSCASPTLVIIVKALGVTAPSAYEQGVEIRLVGVTRNHPQSLNPRIKSNNLLNNALAMQEAIRHGAFEALMKNYRGEICECSQSNFFIVKDGVATTPPIEAGLLAGITRAFVFDLGLETDIPVREGLLREDDVWQADEAFITSTTREIVPVVRVSGRVIGPGSPGPITRRLMEVYRACAARLVSAGAAAH
ncbi:MAG: aminotransferase class IV [Vicinamibacteraceae bacterium]|nr:aminotransferase class IV [Vicinamibacteraceae bacterium]